MLPAPFNGNGDDDISGVLTLPAGFNFRFFGIPVSGFSVGANGSLVFDDSAANCSTTGCYSNVTIPNTAAPNNLIAGYWDDLENMQVCRKTEGLTELIFPLSTAKYTSHPVETVSLDVTINSQVPIKSVYSPTHAVKLERPSDTLAHVNFTSQNEVPTSDFTREIYLCVTVADCVPVLLYSPAQSVIGSVHAGWRGTSDGVLSRAVDRMREVFAVDPADLIAWLGPSAGTCCYTVGEDVAARIDPQFVSRDGLGIVVDLKSANRHQLLAAGVRPDRIEVSPACTISDAAVFHSFRRDRTASGRMMAVIGLCRRASTR